MNSSNQSYQMKNFDDAIIYMYKYVLVVFYVISNVGNLLSLWIFFKKSWKKHVCVFYFKIYLLVNTCYINSTTLGIILTNGFQLGLHHSNIVLCKLYFYTSFLFACLSPTVFCMVIQSTKSIKL